MKLEATKCNAIKMGVEIKLIPMAMHAYHGVQANRVNLIEVVWSDLQIPQAQELEHPNDTRLLNLVKQVELD